MYDDYDSFMEALACEGLDAFNHNASDWSDPCENDLTEHQSNYRRGLLPHQRKAALNAKETRSVLLQHPEGLTIEQIRKLVDHANVLLLQDHGLAYWKHVVVDGKKRAYWFAR